MAVIRPTGYLSHYGFSPEETEEYLAHYGVKGMKWGKHLKAKISDLSDKYITGKSAKEAYKNATGDMLLNGIKKEASESNRKVYLKYQERNTDQSKRYSEAAAKSLDSASKASLKANTAKNERDRLRRELGSYFNPIAHHNEYLPKIVAADKSYSKNARIARAYVGDAKYFTASAKDSEKEADAFKQKAGNAARRAQGHMNAMHAANAKAHSAKRKYDKTVAGKIEKNKQKIMKFLGRG